MNINVANSTNAVMLILMSLWSYNDAMSPNMRLLLPIFYAIALLTLNNGLKYGIATQMRAALFFTLLYFFDLFFMYFMDKQEIDINALIRIVLLSVTSILSSFYIVKGLLKLKKS